MHTVNLGILAHVDAGKTSLTERLLHSAGVVDELGSVDDGTTRTDTMELERRRGITIRSAVASFVVDDVTVNLIDTPGHPDFIAEVERVLSVLDGAVLVVSAVEGVQAQSLVLMRALRRLGIPTLFFVNKIDRMGADVDRVTRGIAERLAPSAVAMGSAHGQGTRAARFVPHTVGDPGFTTALVDLLTARDDALLAASVSDPAAVPFHRLRTALVAQTRRALVHPVFAGSAITGAGVEELMGGVRELLPRAAADAGGPLSGTVFAIERGPAGEKVAYARLFSGTLAARDRLRFGGGRDGEHREGRVTGIAVYEGGPPVRRASLAAGQIGRLWGLDAVRIGDPIGVPPAHAVDHRFSPPTLETVVVPARAADRGALHVALSRLAEQDPLIGLRWDEGRAEISLSLYGEVQKEVVQATLADDFGVQVAFRESTTICVERPVGTGSAVETLGADTNPFLATVGLRVEPGPPGGGVDFRLGVELGSMPYTFFRAVEDTVRETLTQGLFGWQVLDCGVTMTHSGYAARQSLSHGTFDKSMSSTAGDFRLLTPLILMTALRRAGTRVQEPVHRFRLDLPPDTVGAVLPVLARLDAVPREVPGADRAGALGGVLGGVLQGWMPAARVHELRRRLPSVTRGEGVLETAFDHHRPVRGTVPVRPRTDHDPLDRTAYLLHVLRRV